MTATPDCMACSGNDNISDLPLREAVWVGDHWRVALSFNSTLPGWLVVVPRRHVMALHDLTEAEAAPLGGLLRRLSRALSTVTDCEKAYIAFFAQFTARCLGVGDDRRERYGRVRVPHR